MNTEIGFGILLMVDSTAYDLLFPMAISKLALEENYRNGWKPSPRVDMVLWEYCGHSSYRTTFLHLTTSFPML